MGKKPKIRLSHACEVGANVVMYWEKNKLLSDHLLEAAEILKILEENPGEKNPAAVALGRLGGLKGGKARAHNLSPESRSEIARKAANSRWGNNVS